ncbi:MAG TPA: von Willebrand factor type A domain-containing protein, partial [Candidatus Limnocylindria bacterium]|nr:von Willebrand factor type A domain-containing protein [Candidatus Limnocylindria bacterium]
MARPRPRIAVALASLLVLAACSAGSSQTVTGERPQPPLTDPPPGVGGVTNPNDEPYPDVFFDNPGVNPFVDTEDDALSTFALEVDTGSYTVARRFLTDGNLPDKDAIRVEEFVNYFPTGVPAPDGEAFAIHADAAVTPFVQNDRYQVARVVIRSREMAPETRPDAALTFVIDVSGSMEMENRLELVKQSLRLLVTQLRLSDTVAIVVYGSDARVVLQPTPLSEVETVQAAIDALHPEGATNAEAGLVLGYQLARAAFRPGGVNRVILASDGVANVGNTGPDSILAQIRGEAAGGIQLATLGFGMGNYNDVLMEQLADDGDGFYAYVDTIDEAERLFVDELTTTLVTVALDAKVQVSWDQAAVERWRLIGFENRAVADDQFRDDRVEAGAIGPGHEVTALYELKLTDEAASTTSLGTVGLRWTDPDSGEAVEMQRQLAGLVTPAFPNAD